jgi:hypothetical protein
MGSRQIVLVATAGFSVLNTGIFGQEAKTKRLFSQCRYEYIGHTLFCLEFALWIYLEDDWKLACRGAEMS